MAFWCYILRCSDGRFYTGHSDDLERRIAQHQAGGYCDFTARRRPVEVAWTQEFPTRIEALEAERRIKGWSRAKKEAMIAGDWARVSELSVSYAARASTGSARTAESDIAPSLPIRPEPVEGRASTP
jgi:predicted GIY-YIG superfamily endonuclease